MPDTLLIEKKIELLIGYLDELEPLIFGSVEEIKQDSVKRHAIERLFQLAVDSMIDINIHLVRSKNLGAPDDLQSTFKMLGNFGVLDQLFAEKIAPIVGARNMIVHRYEKLDIDMFLNNLKNNFSDFKTYILQLHGFLEK